MRSYNLGKIFGRGDFPPPYRLVLLARFDGLHEHGIRMHAIAHFT